MPTAGGSTGGGLIGSGGFTGSGGLSGGLLLSGGLSGGLTGGLTGSDILGGSGCLTGGGACATTGGLSLSTGFSSFCTCSTGGGATNRDSCGQYTAEAMPATIRMHAARNRPLRQPFRGTIVALAGSRKLPKRT